MRQNPLESWGKHRSLGTTHRVSALIGLWRGPRICISHEFPGIWLVPGPHLEKHWPAPQEPGPVSHLSSLLAPPQLAAPQQGHTSKIRPRVECSAPSGHTCLCFKCSKFSTLWWRIQWPYLTGCPIFHHFLEFSPCLIMSKLLHQHELQDLHLQLRMGIPAWQWNYRWTTEPLLEVLPHREQQQRPMVIISIIIVSVQPHLQPSFNPIYPICFSSN